MGTPQQRVSTLYVYIKNMRKKPYAPVNPHYDKPVFCLRLNKAADQPCGNTPDRRQSRTPQAIDELSANLSSVTRSLRVPTHIVKKRMFMFSYNDFDIQIHVFSFVLSA